VHVSNYPTSTSMNIYVFIRKMGLYNYTLHRMQNVDCMISAM